MKTPAMLVVMFLGIACAVDRSVAVAPTWDDDVAPILGSKCASCHSGAAAKAGWRVDSYLDTIACVADSNTPATLPTNAGAPFLQALQQPPHVGILDDAETATLTAWIASGAPAFAQSVHTPDIINPRSPNFHAMTLRNVHWKPMLDPNDPNACGRCHDGTMSRPSDVTFAAPRAPSCTSCHDQPAGILACGTCHGTDAHAYPPRAPCFFPNDPSGGAHAAHGEPSTIRAQGLPCRTCHPPVGTPVIGGRHGDGAVEVAFDASLVAPEMSWDPATKTCAVSCHDRGGTRPRPAWTDAPTTVTCNDCHDSPPKNHYAGACNRCHAEANATGTALTGGPLHINGKVDLGNGNGTCGACHGKGSDPYPTDVVHQAHENPTLTKPIACTSCHVVPSSVFDAGHLVQPTRVTFSGLAVARGAEPMWNGVSCQNVACHGANLADPAATPVWSDTSGKESKCGACHGVPPTNHTTANDCNRSGCHGSETTSPPNLAITPGGLTLHINGAIDLQ